METADYRATALSLILLISSTALWIDLIRVGIRDGWTWPLQPRRDVPWRPFETVTFIVIVMLCVGALLHQAIPLPAPPPYLLRHVQVGCLTQALIFALVPLILALWYRCQWADFGVRLHGIKDDLQFAVWGVLLAQLPVHLIGYPLQTLRRDNPHAMLEFLQSSAGDPLAFVWIALTLIVLAPLTEELLFRVLLQGALEREVSAKWAILLSAAAFVSIHESVDWAPLLPLALILGYIYYRRRSFLSVVVLHGLFNTCNLLTALWSLPPAPSS